MAASAPSRERAARTRRRGRPRAFSIPFVVRRIRYFESYHRATQPSKEKRSPLERTNRRDRDEEGLSSRAVSPRHTPKRTGTAKTFDPIVGIAWWLSAERRAREPSGA